MDRDRTVLARIVGSVQGVGFRDWARREAGALGLSGWVRNEADGSVSALLCGPAEAVAAMLERLRRGPRAALVERVEVREAEGPVPEGFRILR